VGPASVFYLRINDCGRTLSDELEPIVETIFDLYVKAGARNLMLVDLPPAVESDSAKGIKERVKTWNELPRN
jgi:hypothetical protein